jgi:hypothetical protein
MTLINQQAMKKANAFKIFQSLEEAKKYCDRKGLTLGLVDQGAGYCTCCYQYGWLREEGRKLFHCVETGFRNETWRSELLIGRIRRGSQG